MAYVYITQHHRVHCTFRGSNDRGVFNKESLALNDIIIHLTNQGTSLNHAYPIEGNPRETFGQSRTNANNLLVFFLGDMREDTPELCFGASKLFL